MVEQILAGLGLIACAAVGLGLWAGPARRVRAQQFWQQLWRRGAGARQARREAEAAIERARRGAAAGRWEGNVFRPNSFDSRVRDRSDDAERDR